MTAPLAARHPPQRARDRPVAAGRRRRSPRAPAARSSWSRSPRTATPQREALAQIGGTGVFVTALREALLAGEIDFAVHSLKDLPTAPPEGLALAAVPRARTRATRWSPATG